MSLNRYPVDELRAEAGAQLAWRCAGHPESVFGTSGALSKLVCPSEREAYRSYNASGRELAQGDSAAKVDRATPLSVIKM